MRLTTIDEVDTPDAARLLVERSRQEPQPERRAIMGMITTILVYKFSNLSRREAEEMLGISLKETRLYQELKEEGREEGREQEGRSLTLRLLTHRFGESLQPFEPRITELSIAQIESLAEALLDFQTIADLEAWLENLLNGI